MIDCSECRRSLLAEPRAENPELANHLAQCRECSAYAERLAHFEGRLERALRVDTRAAEDSPGVATPIGAARGVARPEVEARGSARPGVAPSIGAGVAAPGAAAPGVAASGVAASGVAASGAAASGAAASGAASLRRAQARRRGGWLAMAASVLIAVIAAGSLWLGGAHSSLAADVVAHMAGEPQAWARTDVPVPAAELSLVLDAAHIHLRAGAGTVSYAQSCLFRGHRVPHLVVQTGKGPVTVMVLVHESVSNPVPFDEGGYRGVIVPVPGHGSLAVLAQGQDMNSDALRRVASRVLEATVWSAG